jgi:hypothetical protein
VRQRVALAIPAVLAVTLAARIASAQDISPDSVVRVHVITLDSTWYVTGHLVAITGDSVVIRNESDGARVAFERIHVLSVERREPAASVGHSALTGCAIVGGVLGFLGLLSAVSPSSSDGGDGDIAGGSVAVILVPALALVGCAVGAAIGSVAGAVHADNWQAITMPPRTGTEGDSLPAVHEPARDSFPQHLM